MKSLLLTFYLTLASSSLFAAVRNVNVPIKNAALIAISGALKSIPMQDYISDGRILKILRHNSMFSKGHVVFDSQFDNATFIPLGRREGASQGIKSSDVEIFNRDSSLLDVLTAELVGKIKAGRFISQARALEYAQEYWNKVLTDGLVSRESISVLRELYL